MDTQFAQAQINNGNQQFLQILTNDKQQYRVSLKLAYQMGIVRNMTEAYNYRNDLILPLSKVDSQIFDMVLTWCTHMQILMDRNESLPNTSHELGQILFALVPEVNFDDIPFRLISAANYLDINSLLEASTQHVANMISNCETVEVFRENFNVSDDIPSDDEKTEEDIESD